MFNWLFGDNDTDDDDKDKLVLKTDQGNSYTFEIWAENEDYIELTIPEEIYDIKIHDKETLDFYSEMKDNGYKLVDCPLYVNQRVFLFEKVD